METGNSVAIHDGFHEQNDRRGLGPIETINSGHNVAVVSAQNHKGGLGPIETSYSDPKVAHLNTKTTHEGWHP